MRHPIAFLARLLLVTLALAAGSVRGEEPLPPDQAFRFSARAIDAATIEARWQVADGYYLYRDKIKFSLTGGTLTVPALPAGELHDDEVFGKVATLRKELVVRLAVAGAGGAVTLKAQSQGCWDGGICYPPQDHKADLTMPPAAAASPAAAATGAAGTFTAAPGAVSPPLEFQAAASPRAAAASASEDGRIAGLLEGGSLALVLTSFFGFGLLLAFTPCMFPMIPILSGIIVQHGHAVTHARAFVLSLAYVLGMALTYAAIGVAAGLSGTLLSAALQNAWVLGAFALVFVVLALSMFGFYELQLPAALQSRISNVANAQGGSLPAIALMGALSALIVGPCVAAPLAGALLYIAKTGDALLGGTALFVLALGMGAPLLLVGAFSRTLLPKSGPWMTGVNRLFGVLMLATALWLVSPVLPAWLVMFGWAALLVIPAIYLHALDPLPDHAHGWQRLGKGLGVLLLLGGAAMLAGLLGGARDPLQPLTFLRGAQASAVSPSLYFDKVDDSAALDARLASAGKPVMLDFYADWCVSCKEMERFTFADPAVAQAMGRFVLLKADVTANTDAHKALLARFGLFGPPGIIFFDAAGREIAGTRVVGFQPAEKFLAHLQGIEKGR